jgi:hypothetical protein
VIFGLITCEDRRIETGLLMRFELGGSGYSSGLEVGRERDEGDDKTRITRNTEALKASLNH